ncbi:MAG: hypothetical protein AAGI71_05145 [Bacteroidota bacterium]
MPRSSPFAAPMALVFLVLVGFGCSQEPPVDSTSRVITDPATGDFTEAFAAEFNAELRLASQGVDWVHTVEACTQDGQTFATAFSQAHQDRLKQSGWPSHLMAGMDGYFKAHFEDGLADPLVTCRADEQYRLDERTHTFLQQVRRVVSDPVHGGYTEAFGDEFKAELRLANGALELVSMAEACTQGGEAFVSALAEVQRDRLERDGWPTQAIVFQQAYLESRLQDAVINPAAVCDAAEQSRLQEQTEAYIQQMRRGGADAMVGPPSRVITDPATGDFTEAFAAEFNAELRLARQGVDWVHTVEACTQDGQTFATVFSEAHQERLESNGWPSHLIAGMDGYFDAHFKDGIADPTVTCDATERSRLDDRTQAFIQQVRVGAAMTKL